MSVTNTESDDGDTPIGPYAAAAQHYWQAGWMGVLPLPVKAKQPVPRGWTGSQGAWPSFADVFAWCEGREGAGNLALRMPAHVVGLDVDAYGAKLGGATLATLTERFGSLPATWRSTSRNDGTSGIYLFRVPDGLAWPGDLGGGLEVIQTRHRYAVVWPSVHPDTGATYRWITPDGHDSIGDVPQVDELPDLPLAWVQGITGGRLAVDIERADLDDTAALAWLDARSTAGTPCRAVSAALARHGADLRTAAHSRHSVAVAATTRLAHLAGQGHLGAHTAMLALHTMWRSSFASGGDRRPDPGEWNRLLSGAIRIAAAAHPDLALSDPCENPFSDLLGTDTTTWRPSASSYSPTATSTSAAPTSATASGPSAPSPPSTPTNPPSTAPATATTESSPPEPQPEAATGPEPDPQPSAEDILTAQMRAQALAAEVEKQRAQRGARRLLDDEEAATSFRPPVGRPNLTIELAMPDVDVVYRVDQVLPAGANVLLAAQYKAGKTSTVNHLTRCLVDGEPFLGSYAIEPAAGRVSLWNYEVDESMYRRWLREVGISNTDAVSVLNLRGYRLPIVVPAVEDWIVRWHQEHETGVWILDPFARAFLGSGDDENSNSQVGRFLETLDVIKARAGIGELVLPTHTGRAAAEVGQERTRGATRLDDWADVRWLLSIDDEGTRYFRATGRDVEVPEGRIEWDETARRPSLKAGGRKETLTLSKEQAILDAVRLQPGISRTDLIEEVHMRAKDVRELARKLVSDRKLRVVELGQGKSSLHYLTDPAERSDAFGDLL